MSSAFFPFAILPFPKTFIIEIQVIKPRRLPVQEIKTALKEACIFCSPEDLPKLEKMSEESYIAIAYTLAMLYTTMQDASARIETLLVVCRAEGLTMSQDQYQLGTLDAKLLNIIEAAK